MPKMFEADGGILKFCLIMGGEVLLLIFAGVLLHVLIRLLLGRIKGLSDSKQIAERCDSARKLSRLIFTLVTLLLIAGATCFNCWMLFEDKDVQAETLNLIKSMPADAWQTLGKSLLYIIGAVIAAKILNGFISKMAAALEAKAKSWEDLKANDESLSIFFGGLNRILTNVVWIFVVIFTFQQLHLPEVFTNVLYTAVTIYLIIAVGLSIVRMTNVIVDTLDGLSLRYAEKRSWHQYYNSLRPLVPLFRKCLEYALWIVVATMVMMQLGPVQGTSKYGFRLIEAIGLYFITRMLIEVGYLLINKQVMGTRELDDMERRRRETLLPLVKSIFKNVAYFICFVLILRTLGFDIMPFLAGAGILGVVIGLGAQPLINDIMSGFFIILEHMYLVGDVIEGGGAYGTVERIDFRTTKIRDPEGRLHIIRNGDMRQIINYSKEFMYAVVDVDVRYENDPRAAMSYLEGIGQELMEADETVLEATEVLGVLDLRHDHVTIRTKTKVQAGCHATVSAALRLRIAERFAEKDIHPPAERHEIIVNQNPFPST